MESIQLKLVTNHIPVVLQSPDGTEESYELREMTAAGRDSYLTKLGERTRLNTEGKPVGLKNFDGVQAELLALCFYNSKGERVSMKLIQTWPAAAVTTLYKAAQKLNHIGQEEEKTPEKNVSGESDSAGSELPPTSASQ